MNRGNTRCLCRSVLHTVVRLCSADILNTVISRFLYLNSISVFRYHTGALFLVAAPRQNFGLSNSVTFLLDSRNTRCHSVHAYTVKRKKTRHPVDSRFCAELSRNLTRGTAAAADILADVIFKTLTIGVHDIVYTLCVYMGGPGEERKNQNKPNDFWFVLQEHAFESSQKYKEGKYIIEMAHMIKENGWESPPKKWIRTGFFLRARLFVFLYFPPLYLIRLLFFSSNSLVSISLTHIRTHARARYLCSCLHFILSFHIQLPQYFIFSSPSRRAPDRLPFPGDDNLLNNHSW